MRELKGLIRDTDQRIRDAFEETFTAAAKNFEEVAAQLFPGGRGRLRLVREDAGPRAVLGGAEPTTRTRRRRRSGSTRRSTPPPRPRRPGPEDDMGVEIEITPAGKATKRLTLLSGGEKSMTALAFLFAVFLARPCPFYILDEVEAALDDLNIDRFLTLLRRLLRPRAVHRRHPPEAHDGGGRLPLRRLDGRQRRVEGRLAPAAAAARARRRGRLTARAPGSLPPWPPTSRATARSSCSSSASRRPSASTARSHASCATCADAG